MSRFLIEFDPDLGLAMAEKEEALRRMARYGTLRRSTDGWLWTPGRSQYNPEGRIEREGFIIKAKGGDNT